MNGKGSADLGPCHSCGMMPHLLEDGEVGPYKDLDPCLGLVPGVIQACCGHGTMSQAYALISDCDPPGTFISKHKGKLCEVRGERALEWFAEQGVGPWV